MCYKKPGPRCTSHARTAMFAAREAYNRNPTEKTLNALRKAEDAFDTTPGGQTELRAFLSRKGLSAIDRQWAECRLEKGEKMRELQLKEYQDSLDPSTWEKDAKKPVFIFDGTNPALDGRGKFTHLKPSDSPEFDVKAEAATVAGFDLFLLSDSKIGTVTEGEGEVRGSIIYVPEDQYDAFVKTRYRPNFVAPQAVMAKREDGSEVEVLIYAADESQFIDKLKEIKQGRKIHGSFVHVPSGDLAPVLAPVKKSWLPWVK